MFTAIIALNFISCEDPYADQKIADPSAFAEVAPQDTTGYTVTLKSGVSPLIISTNQLTQDLTLLNVSKVLTPKDSAVRVQYKFEFADNQNFSNPKTIPISYDGKAGSDVKVGCKQFNDSIKVYNKNAVKRTLYIRLLAAMVNGGTKSVYTSGRLTLEVTPNNYAPVLLNDVVSLAMGTSATVDVLSNDTDPEGDVLTITSVGTPSKGTASIVDGKIMYKSTATQATSDNFSYTVSDGNGNSVTANVDVTVLSVVPYTAITPRPYYIIGMANGGWNNSTAGLGVSIYPLSVVAGNKYNTAGDGEFTYTGYFWSNRGFKLIRDLGNWDEQWGIKNGVIVHNDGGSSDIKVAADGYYTITLNSISNTMTMVPASVTPTSYSSMSLSGDFNGWSSSSTPMIPAETSNNHVWYATITVPSDGGIKFNYNSWATDWGGTSFPVGIGGKMGNIPIKAGTYTVLFNDIDGTYYFK